MSKRTTLWDPRVIAFVCQQAETQRQFFSTDYSYYSFLADTRSSAHLVFDRIILQIWRDKMHPTVKWCPVVCSWAEPIGHVTSVAGDNRPACPSRRGYTQLVKFLERRSQILNTEILIFHAYLVLKLLVAILDCCDIKLTVFIDLRKLALVV